jgi:heme exporter protein A
MALVAEGVSLVRGGRLVVAGLDVTLPDGRALLLRGPNGAGKTTLLRALAGLLPLAAGRVTLDGDDLAREPDRVQERTHWAGHLDALKPALTVRENLAAWAGLFGGDPAAAMAALGLAAIADRPVAACSAGQKRRAGLARLLLASRRLWLLDEPTVSLDAEAVSRLAGLVRAHCAEGGLAVIATHAELELPAADSLVLVPPGPAGRDAADPFLAAGRW